MNLSVFGSMWVRPEEGYLPLDESADILADLSEPVYVFEKGGLPYISNRCEIALNNKDGFFPLTAFDYSFEEVQFGSGEFLAEHGLKYPYIAGGMANGIASVKLVIEMGKSGFMGFFGTGGLELSKIEEAVRQIKKELSNNEPFGINIISTSAGHDRKVIELLLEYDIRKIEVAGAIVLTPAVVQYRLHGIHRENNRIIVPNKVFAKISREEVARLFMSPPPKKIVDALLNEGKITHEEAELSAEIPMSDDIIAEADSGGHTDNRPALLLFQNMVNFRDQILEEYKYKHFIPRIGAAGGISTPATALAAFTLGADFIVSGSVNQSCIEAKTSEVVKQMLCQITMSDVANAPSADMFEMGSKVQVMTRGLMFHMKANKLYELYQNYKSIDEIPEKTRQQLEEKTFRDKIENIWQATKTYFMERSPETISKAESNPKFKMALIFRWYLGSASKWAQNGDTERKVDFQILCGPSMGAFNRWVKGTYMEYPENRRVVDVALNIIHGMGYLRRVKFLMEQGIKLKPELVRVIPKPRV